MNKEELYALIEEMTDDTPFTDSDDSISWSAYRKAEKISDPKVFPVLREIIEENDHKRNVQKRNVRDAAYFIGGKLLEKTLDYDFCRFYIQRLCVESSKYVLSSMLDRLAEFDIEGDFDIEPILDCAKNEKWQIRQSAIKALGSFCTNESKECLRSFVRLDDEKKYEYEIYYAQYALGRIGDVEDIGLLQMHANSRKQDIKGTARFAQDQIRKRHKL